jgi:hypothetical protein
MKRETERRSVVWKLSRNYVPTYRLGPDDQLLAHLVMTRHLCAVFNSFPMGEGG